MLSEAYLDHCHRLVGIWSWSFSCRSGQIPLGKGPGNRIISSGLQEGIFKIYYGGNKFGAFLLYNCIWHYAFHVAYFNIAGQVRWTIFEMTGMNEGFH